MHNSTDNREIKQYQPQFQHEYKLQWMNWMTSASERPSTKSFPVVISWAKKRAIKSLKAASRTVVLKLKAAVQRSAMQGSLAEVTEKEKIEKQINKIKRITR